MAVTTKVRCAACNALFAAQTAHTTTTKCPIWENIVHDDTATNVPLQYQHPSGGAIFAYDEALRLGAPVPAWANGVIPASTDAGRERTLLAQASTALGTNTTFLALANPSTAQNAAQIKALTRQVSALIRFQLRRFDAID